MEKIKVEESVGKILGTDVTIIIPGVRKGPLFKKGHIIESDDIPKLLSIGKHYVWVETSIDAMAHEDDAGRELMSGMKGENLTATDPSESKVKLIASCDGVLLVNRQGLRSLNSLKDVNVCSRKHLSYVKKGEPIAIGKVMPKEIPASEMGEIKARNKEFFPVLTVLPILKNRIALFPVGSEFIEGLRIETMSDKLKNFLKGMGQEVFLKKILPDDEVKIKEEGNKAIDAGADIIIFIGGMAVDPDDKTVDGIELMGTEVVRYGVPVFPGQTFLVSYKGNIPVLGVPSSAGFFERSTSFHLLMPVFLARYRLSKDDILNMAEGGFINA